MPTPQHYQRRHSRWYERVLLNPFFQLLSGLVIVVGIPGLQRWGYVFPTDLNPVQINTLLVNSCCFLLIFILGKRFRQFPGAQSLAYTLPTVYIIYLLGFSSLFFLREPYSRQVLFLSFISAQIWFFSGHFISLKIRRPKLAIIPYGKQLQITDENSADLRPLSEPSLNELRFDAVVADLHTKELPPEWERFLANCTLAQIPVYHFRPIQESLTGQVRINHLSENEVGSLIPSQGYALIKRTLDILAALILIPLCFPLLCLVALLIKLDSPGPVFFRQKRMGYRGKSFILYKLRSMRPSQPGKNYTQKGYDPRITRVGRFIRKYRIDEFPQFFNVLKGDMSFIGPRPESMQLTESYEKDVPFFSYRHIVRPGISGWAQVKHGYAAEVKGMTEKLGYDFYYIKHFSFWLDCLIFIKTLRTVLTGFGAR